MKMKISILNKKEITRVLFISSFLIGINFVSIAQVDTTSLKRTLPGEGKMQHNKPNGKGWVDLLDSTTEWNFENNFWHFTDSSFHGEMGRETEHHYSYTKKTYKDFELNVMIRMV